MNHVLYDQPWELGKNLWRQKIAVANLYCAGNCRHKIAAVSACAATHLCVCVCVVFRSIIFLNARAKNLHLSAQFLVHNS